MCMLKSVCVCMHVEECVCVHVYVHVSMRACTCMMYL